MQGCSRRQQRPLKAEHAYGAERRAIYKGTRPLQATGESISCAAPTAAAGLSVYHLHVEKLRELRPDVVLTCLQTAHGAVLEGELLAAALEAALGSVPKVGATAG